MNAGSITFSTALDNEHLEKDLSRLTKKIEKTEQEIADLTVKRDEAKQKGLFDMETLDEEKAKLHEMEKQLADIRAASKDKTLSLGTREELKAQLPAVREELADQKTRVSALQTEWNRTQTSVERYDEQLKQANQLLDRQKDEAGELVLEIEKANGASAKMAKAAGQAQVYMGKITTRMKQLAVSAFVFTLISKALSNLKDWLGKVIKSNDEARSSIARLKGALLTLAQPLVEVVVPAFISLANVLTDIVTAAAQIMSALFGTTAEESAKAAEELYNETNALEATGEAADEAAKSLAGFDEINKLSGKNTKNTIQPDFSGVGSGVESGWLSGIMDKVAAWVPAALTLGGIALVAIGASLGNLLIVLAGLGLLGHGLMLANEKGQLESWSEALGLNNVQEFVVFAVLLGGIAIVAIGATTCNILMVIAGLLLIGVTIAYATQSGMMKDWANTLGLAKAAQYVTAALLIGGFALVVIGAATANILMVIAGIALIAAGVLVGTKTGVIKQWWEALELGKAENFITAALLIGGIALTIFGIASGNIMMFIAGFALIYAGYEYGEGKGVLDDWWDALKLDEYSNHITAALLIGGIALTIFGIITMNVLMFIAGLSLIYAGYKYGEEKGALGTWYDTLNLKEYSNYITAAMLIGGMALLVFGIITVNILMALAGIALFIAGASFSVKTGTSGTWWDALGLPEVPGWVSTALMLGGIALIAIGAMMLNPFLVILGLGLLGASVALGSINSNKLNGSIGKGLSASVNAGTSVISNVPSMQSVNLPPIPALAQGAVIPPNREFLAVLGDQKSGTNIEAPVSEIEAAVTRGIQKAGGAGGGPIEVTVNFTGTVSQLIRMLHPQITAETNRRGANYVEGAT